MKKYEIIVNNNVINNDIEDKYFFIEGSFIKIFQNDCGLHFKINELIFRSLEIILLNTKNSLYIIIKRNESCYLYICGQINCKLRGKYYNNSYLFSNCYLKLKIKKNCKIKQLEDLSIFEININGIAYFKNINSKIPLNSENSLLIERSYD